MQINYRDPEITLVSSVDQVKEAWSFSHPYSDQSSSKIDELVNMDLPLSGFRHYVFKVVGSILFRDLVFTMRPLPGAWARSNRSLKFDNNNTSVSGEYKSIGTSDWTEKTLLSIYEDIANGQEVDLVKPRLPMSVSTEFMFSMDDRSLVTFLKTLKKHNIHLYNVYGKLLLKAINKTEDYIDNRKSLDIFNKLAIQESERSLIGKPPQEMGEMTLGVFTVSNNLMAQFIRQHYSTVKNELYNKIDNHVSLEDISYFQCNDKTVVAVYANKEAIKKLISVRSCFIAQWDKESDESWSSIIGPFVGNLTAQQFKNILPCHGDRRYCTITKAVEERVVGTDVNCPCPILLEAPWIVDYRGKRYDSDSKVYKAWSLMKWQGLINDNPDNEWGALYKHRVNDSK